MPSTPPPKPSPRPGRDRRPAGAPQTRVRTAADQAYARSLVVAICVTIVALLAGIAAAGADNPKPGTAAAIRQPLCLAADGTVHVAPQGVASGSPCPASASQPPAEPVKKAEELAPAQGDEAPPNQTQPEPQPAAPAEPQPATPTEPQPATPTEPQPASPAEPQPTENAESQAPQSSEPITAEPGSVTVEPQKVQAGVGTTERRRKTKPASRRRRKAERPRAVKKPAVKPERSVVAAAPKPEPKPLVLAPELAPREVPNILLDRFQIPPFLLPLYQAAGVEYGVRWEILAAINSIETDYGRNLSVSSAGALGWMQFMPATWKAYGVDANGDGRKDPYNPVDAIFAAARYLRAAGAGDNMRRAIFAYNHADWYVNDVIGRADTISRLPDEVVASLSGLTLGRFPVAARSIYAGRLSTKTARAAGTNASVPVGGNANRRGMKIYAAAGSPVVAVQDAVVVGIGKSRRLGNFVRLQDAYGNRYVYAHLAKIATTQPVPRKRRASSSSIRRELGLTRRDPKPKRAATAGRRGKRAKTSKAKPPTPVLNESAPQTLAVSAHMDRPRGASLTVLSGGLAVPAGVTSFEAWFAQPYTLDPSDVVLRPLKKGSRVIGGTILGRIGRASLRREGYTSRADRRAERAIAQVTGARKAPHVWFEVRPAGSASPRVDPKPILDGWRLLEQTAIYRAKNALVEGTGQARKLTPGQVLLMSKEQLQRHVLNSPDIEIYECGRQDISAGIVDRRVLASLAFLAAKGLKPAVTSLRCGHGYLTSTGNVSHHSFGSAVDIAAINGVPVYGNQGAGSITDKAVRELLTLQGTMKPAQIITLMQYSGTDNTYAMGDHADHIHLGFDPREDAATSVLRPGQWDRLIGSLERVPNPIVPLEPSKYAIEVTGNATAGSSSAGGER